VNNLRRLDRLERTARERGLTIGGCEIWCSLRCDPQKIRWARAMPSRPCGAPPTHDPPIWTWTRDEGESVSGFQERVTRDIGRRVSSGYVHLELAVEPQPLYD
jgi:hypothetical protein